MSEVRHALPCFVCQKPLQNVESSSAINQPMRGTEFISYGHYGSTIFDPMDGTILVMNVCDPCLSARMTYTRTMPSKHANAAELIVSRMNWGASNGG